MQSHAWFCTDKEANTMRSEHSLKPCFNSLFQIAAGLEQALTTRISIRAEKSFKVRGAKILLSINI